MTQVVTKFWACAVKAQMRQHIILEEEVMKGFVG